MNGQLLYLVICNFAIVFVGMGVFPLLPIYAGKFGATPAAVGIYLALTYVSITLGTLLTGWLSGVIARGRFSRKLIFVSAGVVGVPALFLLGHAVALWQVVVLTGIVWFTGGIGMANISVYAGLHAAERSRRKWFSLIALTTPLGAIAGGFLTGPLAEGWGYPAMFALAAVVYALWPLVGLWKVQDRQPLKTGESPEAKRALGWPGMAYLLLLLVALFSAMTISVIRLGLSLTMKAGGFSLSAITGANVIGGLATIPIVLGFGSLSDRLGRKLFLALGYLLAAASGITLVIAVDLWHFWLVAAFMLIARSVSGSLASALAADLVAPESLGRLLPWVNTMTWVAGVLGFAGSGYIIETLGEGTLYRIAALLSLAAAGFVVLIKVCSRGLYTKPAGAGQPSSLLFSQDSPQCPAP